jgi:transposase-like protein
MLAEKRQTYPAEFTRDVVRLVTEHPYGVAEAARHLGLKTNRLRRWTRACAAQAHGAFPGTGRLSPAQAALPRRRAENTR